MSESTPPGVELSGYSSCANRKIAEPEKPRYIGEPGYIRERETGCRKPTQNCFSCPYFFMVLRGMSGNWGITGKVGRVSLGLTKRFAGSGTVD